MKKLIFVGLICYTSLIRAQDDSKYRPVIHFTPPQYWMNDPNGMIYHEGTYHLFYQHHPYSSVWGPMHWGHATSRDLIKWEHQPIALFPDKNGMIFSGSAVYDKNNTSGLGKNDKGPLVAIFTYHNDSLAKQGSYIFQTQGIAYSNDDGKTWTKYDGNPVLKNPGIKDFRDPKVFWHDASKKWIMTLAVFDRLHFYGSQDLKTWNKLSEFGVGYGVPNVLWECPDLFSMKYMDKTIWVLLSNINPGGPNKGSSTQYFIGEFDGQTFKPFDKEIRWADFGPDEYAGITWSNTGDRKIYTGWMSNWLYAQLVPTETWRSALTIARDLELKYVNGKYYLASMPVKELNAYKEKALPAQNGSWIFKKSALFEANQLPVEDFQIEVSNEKGEVVTIGYEKASNNFYIDRINTGNINFHKEFPQKSLSKRISSAQSINFKLIIDVASIELFADDGLNTMSSIFFPTTPLSKIKVKTATKGNANDYRCFELLSALQ